MFDLLNALTVLDVDVLRPLDLATGAASAIIAVSGSGEIRALGVSRDPIKESPRRVREPAGVFFCLWQLWVESGHKQAN